MKKIPTRPRKEKPRKLTILGQSIPLTTQSCLAEFQQLVSDHAELENRISKKGTKIRTRLLQGGAVEVGPIRAFLRMVNGKRKLFVK